MNIRIPRPLLAVALVLGIVFAFAAPRVWAAVTGPTASCTANPAITKGATTESFSVRCSVPLPPAVTQTVTVPGPTVTVTADPAPAPSDTPAPVPSDTVTPTPPAPTPTATETPAPPSSTPTVDPPVTTGFPDASNTGVPDGTILRKVPSEVTSGPGWTWANGMIKANDNAVLDSLDIAGGIEVYGTNVTISKVRASISGDWWIIGVRGGTATIKDSDLFAGQSGRAQVGIKDVCGCSVVNVYRSDISGWSSGIQISRGIVEGNYVHSSGFVSGDHTNAFTDNGGRSVQAGDSATNPILAIRNNTFLCDRNQTDAISLFQDFGNNAYIVVDHNLLAGGSYSLYAGGGPKGTSHDIVIKNNQWSSRYFSTSGVFGPVTAWQPTGANNTWSNNTWADGPNAGKPVNPN